MPTGKAFNKQRLQLLLYTCMHFRCPKPANFMKTYFLPRLYSVHIDKKFLPSYIAISEVSSSINNSLLLSSILINTLSRYSRPKF